jgi:hypothetical protein
LFGSNGNQPTETGLSIAPNGVINFAPQQTFPSTAGGTVVSVNTGAGLTGGPITTNGTISIASAGVSNTMLANPYITVQAGAGLLGGGTVALGGTVTLTNASPSSGGTITSINSGTGLTGGTITTSGTFGLDTNFTDARYLQSGGGSMTGTLNGTTAAFSGTLSAAGAVMPKTGSATAIQGFISNPFDLQASAYSSKTSLPVTQNFRWQAEPAGNNSSNPSGTLNLLFGSNGISPAETGLSIANNGVINFASGQTFPGTGSGTVTTVNTGAGLAGGPITGSGTISIPTGGVSNSMLANSAINIQAGPGLLGGGPVGLGGTVTLSGNFYGTAQGIAYFSSPTSLVSTPAPSNGQILIGSTGGTPVLGTLTAGSNISITNGPGSVTISATDTSSLPYFVMGGGQIGAFQGFIQNVTQLWGFLLPYNVTTTKITYDVTTPDNTGNTYDIGIFDNSGNLLVDIGPTSGSTFAPSQAFHTLSWIQGPKSLTAGRYYLGVTTNCSMSLKTASISRPGSVTVSSIRTAVGIRPILVPTTVPSSLTSSSCAQLAASASRIGFAINASAGSSQGGTLPSSVTPPTDNWSSGAEPAVVIQ